MIPVVETLGFAFLIGLSGALVPGPTLVATIQASMKGGWITGPKVTLGHILLETFIFAFILLGISATAVRYSRTIALVGGVALLFFGILTLRESTQASMDQPGVSAIGNPYLAGIITGITNPYFWIWWLTIGSALLVDVMEGGIFLGLVFMIGHWGADVGWLTLVSTGIHRGRAILSPRGYIITLIFCGVVLILFGIYFLSNAFWAV